MYTYICISMYLLTEQKEVNKRTENREQRTESRERERDRDRERAGVGLCVIYLSTNSKRRGKIKRAYFFGRTGKAAKARKSKGKSQRPASVAAPKKRSRSRTEPNRTKPNRACLPFFFKPIPSHWFVGLSPC